MMLFSENKYRGEWLWAILVFSLFFGIVYKEVFQYPNHFLVAGGDGMKNYYTFMYHVKHDSTLMTFEGMNYPFGENIIFTDNQPLLANTTKILAPIFPTVLCHLPAIHNISLILGLILGTLGLFLCFRQLKLDFLFALLSAMGLMLLHPQADRIHGHFAMFYPVLPWIFLLWLKIINGQHILKLSVWIGALITLTGLLHMYFFITGAILVCLVFFVWVISSRSKPRLPALMGAFAIQVVIPFLILQFFTSYFNHAADRPASPWGFFHYHSYWEGLLFSYKLPLYHFIDNNIVKVRDFDIEGKSYIGILGALTCLFGIGYGIKNILSILKNLRPKDERSILIYIFILSALISFGLPFTIKGLEGLLDYTGPFKQFRSIGRVAWISFYAINLIAIPWLYHWIKEHYSLAKRDILYFVLPTVMIIEGLLFYYQRPVQHLPIDAYYCPQNQSVLPVSGADYQALLPDPYFNVGSECYSWGDQGHNVNQNFELSYQLHLPTMGVNMSRTSFSQAFLLNELTCLPYKVPDIIQMLKVKDPRPLLVVETKNDINDRRASLTHWTKYAPVVFESDQFKLRKMELSMFDTISATFIDSIQALKDTLEPQSFPLKFTKVKSEKGWGYEASIPKDTSMIGPYLLTYWIECHVASDVHAITEIWQFDGNHRSIDYIGEANRFNYKQYDGTKLRIDIPLNIKAETIKLVFRISKEKQKEADNVSISEPLLIQQLY